MISDGVETLKHKYYLAKDVDFHINDKFRKEALYRELSQLLNL